jgi:LPS-assembly lipoprotein
VTLLALSACGFEMRGAQSVPTEMERTYISANNRHSQFYQSLRRELQASGVEIVDTPVDSTAEFVILRDDTGQRVLSVSGRNVPQEFEVFYTVQYQLISGENTLMEIRQQTLMRDYTWDETLVLGKEHEQEVMRDALVDDLIRVILIQLSSL